ncbi:MAG: alpha/beta fold hydrolase [Nisaea sp.]|uniref:alpha/beta fold hydrolase n=1 Tax=Nisaea sp. TaxID=2024842 RepID=UPI001B21FF67|nr:alpha/beta fold hydrolase [Nisaea sp.]MBO6561173.1 alpha/beta fold hydrolase [Nisaea sp.]
MSGTEKDSLPWLVMVHGMSQDRRIFDRQAEVFSDTHRVLALDLLGHGEASDAAGPFGHIEFSAHILGQMRAHGVTHARFWGTHTGAAVGLYLAATEPPGLIDALVLEAPVIPGRNPDVANEMIARVRRVAAEAGMEEARRVWWEESCWFETMRADPETRRASEQRRIVEDFKGRPWTDTASPAPVGDFGPALSRIAIPVLIYNGSLDHRDFLRLAAEIDALTPTSESVLIDGAGGFPAWEDPDQVNQRVKSFLGNL